MKQETQIARAMNALSHPRRVMLFTILDNAGQTGLGFDELQKKTRFTATVLRHHLRPMQAAGLVIRRREGTRVVFRLHGRSLRKTTDYISHRLTQFAPPSPSMAHSPPLN